jgi:hypothetical protein
MIWMLLNSLFQSIRHFILDYFWGINLLTILESLLINLWYFQFSSYNLCFTLVDALSFLRCSGIWIVAIFMHYHFWAFLVQKSVEFKLSKFLNHIGQSYTRWRSICLIDWLILQEVSVPFDVEHLILYLISQGHFVVEILCYCIKLRLLVFNAKPHLAFISWCSWPI